MTAGTGREHGDRARFLAEARARLRVAPEPNRVHPPPAPPASVPSPFPLVVDPDDLPGTFTRIATDQGSEVHRAAGSVPDAAVVADLVERHGIRTAVCSAEAIARGVGELVSGLGVDVVEPTRGDVAAADLGITSAVAIVAATGSLVIDTSLAGSRLISLLPRVHLCVAPVDRLVPTPSDVWRRFTGHPERLPSNLVWISGPSRTGDIEQLLTIGVHGPVACAVVLTDSPAAG
jgi:L-lactate dehydrogenase complex protein LldG